MSLKYDNFRFYWAAVSENFNSVFAKGIIPFRCNSKG